MKEHPLWPVFEKWAIENGVSTEHEDDWGTWWGCFITGASHKQLEDEIMQEVITPTLTELAAELHQWRTYASYLNCCAKSGEHKVLEFEAFLKSLEGTGIVPQ